MASPASVSCSAGKQTDPWVGSPLSSTHINFEHLSKSKKFYGKIIYVSPCREKTQLPLPTVLMNRIVKEVKTLKCGHVGSQASSRLVWGLTIQERSLGQLFPMHTSGHN